MRIVTRTSAQDGLHTFHMVYKKMASAEGADVNNQSVLTSGSCMALTLLLLFELDLYPKVCGR